LALSRAGCRTRPRSSTEARSPCLATSPPPPVVGPRLSAALFRLVGGRLVPGARPPDRRLPPVRKGELQGACAPRTDWHLVVLTGASDTHVFVNDPAGQTMREVPRAYRRRSSARRGSPGPASATSSFAPRDPRELLPPRDTSRYNSGPCEQWAR
jgi:hypothetical protein